LKNLPVCAIERPFLCPFCHGRMRVLEPFRKLEWALYGDDAANPDAKVIRPDLRVLAFRTPMRSTVDAGQWMTDLVPRAHCERATELIRERRTREVKLWSASFGTVWFHVFPLPQENRLAIFRSGVLLVPAGMTEESLTSSPHTDAKLFSPSKASLCKTFSRSMAFDKRLFRVPPRTLVSLLHGMRNVRLQQGYGRIPRTAVMPDGYVGEHDEETE
jgi:hypothetical protein